jgi:effector-binding domain-containing protein
MQTATIPAPQLEQRGEQPYAALRLPVTADRFEAAVDAGWLELFARLSDAGVDPAGDPFIRYLAIDPGGRSLEIELGVPVSAPVEGDELIRPGLLPAGRYLTLRHTGPRVREAHAALVEWAAANGVELDGRQTAGGTAWWRSRLERYLDPARDEIELACLTA